MDSQKYILYTVDDYLDDYDFLLAVKYGDPAKEEFWNQLLVNRLLDEAVYLEARQYLMLIGSAEQILPPAGFLETLEQDIKYTIRLKSATRTIKLKRMTAAVAAAVLFMCMTTYWFYHSQITVTTKYGQMVSISLPDGTHVILNSSSSISYPRAMAYGAYRKVKLQGEAFFDVVHLNHDTLRIKPDEIFTVSTRQLNVQVLGTKFNVKERRGHTDVYLVQGKVRVTGKQVQQILKPAELLTYNSASFRKTSILKESQTAWMNHRMSLHNASLRVVLENFEDVFGKKIILQDTSLYHKTIDGTILMENEKNALFILSTITNTHVEQHGDKFYLTTAN